MALRLLADRLRERCGEGGEVFAVRAPLRVCPLGAHVDHQGGDVTGLALDREVRLVARSRDEPVVTLESIGFPGVLKFDLRDPGEQRDDWGDYFRAVVLELFEICDLRRGFDGALQGELGSMGVSSSAAVMVAYCLALVEANQGQLSRTELARLIQRAENRHIGVSSGLLDQSVILFAEADRLTHVDCRNFGVSQVAAETRLPDFRIVVAFSGTTRRLLGTGYNDRVGECRRAAVALLRSEGIESGESPVLSDVSRDVFEREGRKLPENQRRRATHFFDEVARVHAGIEAWRRGDLGTFGALVNASGESSIVNYQCGTPPLVALFESLRDAPGVFGARFSGAGFGGSCVALVESEASEDIVARVSREFAAAFPEQGELAQFSICRPAGRAEVIPPGDFS